MARTARALRIFAIAWAARALLDGIEWKTALAVALAAFAAGSLARAEVDRRVRITSVVVATLLAVRALPFVLHLVFGLLEPAAILNATREIATPLDLAAVGCAFATARAGGAKQPSWIGVLAATAAFMLAVREWAPWPRTFFADESRTFLFSASALVLGVWAADAANRIDPSTRAPSDEEPALATGRRVALGIGAWLFASVLFVGSAIFLAVEKMPTWNPYYVEAFAALVASAAAIALVGPAGEVSRRTACIAAAVAWTLHAATLHFAVRAAQALLWDAMDGRDVRIGVAVADAVAFASWPMGIAGVVLVSVVLHRFARDLGHELLARIALAAIFPFAVGVVLELIRPGARPRAGWVDLAFAGCSVLAYGMLGVVAYRILFPARNVLT